MQNTNCHKHEITNTWAVVVRVRAYVLTITLLRILRETYFEKLKALCLVAHVALTKPLATNVEFSLLPLLACTALAVGHFFDC